jgi:hypothetical protein
MRTMLQKLSRTRVQRTGEANLKDFLCLIFRKNKIQSCSNAYDASETFKDTSATNWRSKLEGFFVFNF